MRWGICLLILSCLMSGCLFGSSSGRKTLGYRNGTVFMTGNHNYHIGVLPQGWVERNPGRNAVSFYNEDLGSEIVTAAFCDSSFEDAKLSSLMGQLMTGLRPNIIKRKQEIMIDGRGALRQESLRTVDGVTIAIDAVVLKKDYCNFDLYLIAPPNSLHEARPTFDNIIENFHF